MQSFYKFFSSASLDNDITRNRKTPDRLGEWQYDDSKRNKEFHHYLNLMLWYLKFKTFLKIRGRPIGSFTQKNGIARYRKGVKHFTKVCSEVSNILHEGITLVANTDVTPVILPKVAFVNDVTLASSFTSREKPTFINQPLNVQQDIDINGPSSLVRFDMLSMTTMPSAKQLVNAERDPSVALMALATNSGLGRFSDASQLMKE
ncbi:hypothetical protein DAPPUDRAFT_115588 [Daphnia pulex]|uniref:Uncharacterized protein n=1 Tax=Daphnia pulex TaxID=6669 RepID=E9HLX0_DAPPU|nr:hypothetical protein DAPPUDRAFT_115588 [Daphnia pulex]|eukprot:EFX67264.1 hypothetical protein DAPPUDRAFT_115588 [Daphnia pulex]